MLHAEFLFVAQEEIRQRKEHVEQLRIAEEGRRKLAEEEAAVNREKEKQLQDRQKKIDLVNAVNLTIRETDQLLLIGPKVRGRLHFCGCWVAVKNRNSLFGDGTVTIVRSKGYIESIGLRGWTQEELVRNVHFRTRRTDISPA